ncbi:PspA/IM30 family protein [Microcoleus vaginatus]|uniref:PspA/IM30 family protein n=1 Tax=Microcoleus vaginatus TaxID=119532 RepID=UPI00403F3C7E
MLDNHDQPKPYDAVRGGQLPPPVGGVVLGGLAGVKHRLSSSVSEHRIAALRETLNYGDAGLKIVIKICQSETGPVQRAACDLLRQRLNSIAREKLQAFVASSSDSEAKVDSSEKILKHSSGAVSEKNYDRQMSEAQLIFETVTQQMQPNLLLLEALVASVEREEFTSELMNLWELLILEIQEPLKELRQAVGTAISAQLRIQWLYNQAESQANQWQQRALLALQTQDENSVPPRRGWQAGSIRSGGRTKN